MKSKVTIKVRSFFKIVGFTLGLSSLFAPFGASAQVATQAIKPVESNWEKISEDQGVTVWRQAIPLTPVFAFRGETIIDSSIAKIMTVMKDTSRKKEWVADLAESRDIRQVSPLVRIEYNHTKTPPGLSDRDFVFQAEVEVNKAEKKISIEIKSVEDPLVPEVKGLVRGKLYSSRYIFTALEGGQRTLVRVEILVDPKGSIPTWIVNLVQKKWPTKTLAGIRNQVAKSDIKEDEEVLKAFSQ